MIPSHSLKNIKTASMSCCIVVLAACTGATDPGPDPLPDPNVAPTVSVTTPQNYRFDSKGVAIQPNAEAISAVVADADDNLDKVELFIDDVKAGQTLRMPPYKWTMEVVAGLDAGIHTLKVLATDTDGESESDSASVRVNFNTLPTVEISGISNMADIDYATSLNIGVDASDTDGQVQSVDLQLDGQSLGIQNQAPYRWNAANINALSEISSEGRHDLSAVAVDNDGESASAQIFFTVKEKPTTGDAPMKPGVPSEENIAGVGPHGACVIDENEKPRCWGGNYMPNGCALPRGAPGSGEGGCMGRATPPKNIGKIFALGSYHVGACALLKQPINGSNIRCWGPESAPTGPKWNDAVQLAGGDRHVCVLREMGEVNCFSWGSGSNKPAPNDLRAKFIAGSHLFNCAIRKNDSKVQCWGNNPPRPPGNLLAKTLSASENHVCAIAMDDSVVCWGSGGGVNVPNGLKARSVAAGGTGSCAVRLDGSPVCWGNNNLPGDKGPNYTSVFISPNTKIGSTIFIKKNRDIVETRTYKSDHFKFIPIEKFKAVTPP